MFAEQSPYLHQTELIFLVISPGGQVFSYKIHEAGHKT